MPTKLKRKEKVYWYWFDKTDKKINPNKPNGYAKEKFIENISDGLKATHNPEDDARKQARMFINLQKLSGITL